MSDDRQEQSPEVEREERRLERLRLVSVPTAPDYGDDEDDGPTAA